MNFILSPAIALTNKLSFKAKFSLLSLIFFIPITVSALWIVSAQWQRISQYNFEIEGLDLIRTAVHVEQAKYQVENNSHAASLNQKVLTSSFAEELATTSQKAFQSKEIKNKALLYENTLTFREHVAALSGLSRDSEASAFYLSQMVVKELPAISEYLSRTGELTSNIIESNGFTAESYTLLVALEKRLDELQVQLKKANEQLSRVDENLPQLFISKMSDLFEAIDEYQIALQNNVINPDNIKWQLAQAKKSILLPQNIIKEVYSTSAELLSKKLQSSRSNSILSLLVLSLVLITTAIITAFLLIIIYLSIKQNVESINKASSRLEAGDFTQDIIFNSKDELGSVAEKFNQMQHKIRHLLNQFNQDAKQLKLSANNINQLSSSMEINLANQQGNTHNVVNAIQQVSESVGVISSTTINAQAITEQANNNVLQGQDVISKTEVVINDISQEVNKSATVINELAGFSNDIGQFVNVIREIADQTNLLALNAAIEAARAGEQGRGFAVVADEVRTLASRTQDSTGEIQRIIEQLQKGAERSVEAMNLGVAQAENGVKQTKQVGATFFEVSQNVQNIVDGTENVNKAVEQQSQLVENIVSHTDSIANGANEVMEGARNSAQAGKDLLHLADNLSQQLAKFTLEK